MKVLLLDLLRHIAPCNALQGTVMGGVKIFCLLDQNIMIQIQFYASF